VGQGSAGSPPTDRALDVIELLARRHHPVRLAIVATLCDRGWAARDPHDKSLSLGPALQVAAAKADDARPLAHATRLLAAQLAEDLDYAASVTERVGDSLLLTFFEGYESEPPIFGLGELIPFAAPFGATFAAWAPEPERRRWVERTARDNVELRERLHLILEMTKARGYSVERMTPALTRTAQLMDALGGDDWAQDFRRVVEEALLEVATASLASEPDVEGPPIMAIVAPVFDDHGMPVLNVGIHPFRTLSATQVERLGRRLASAANAPAGPAGSAQRLG
jgi:DNA-binding IclR family transcriptional regulator